jgi:hypothetical protein
MNQLHEAVPLALSVAIRDQKYARAQPMTRAVAILLVGQLGQRRDVDQLERLLEDSTVCAQISPGQSTTTVQIRDVALVVMLHLTGQRPADYGYVHAQLQSQQVFQLETLSVANEQQREKALSQWRSWRAQHAGAQTDAS